MKEYDIFLNRRLNEANIILNNIPYRDGLSVTNRLVIESMISYYTLQKFIAGQTKSVMLAEIEKFLKKCYERISSMAIINVNASLISTCFNELESIGLVFSPAEIATLERSFFELKNIMCLTLPDIESKAKSYASMDENSICVLSECTNDQKRDFECAFPDITISTTDIGTFDRRFANADAQIFLDSGETNIIYKYAIAVSNAYAVAIKIAEIEIHATLGRGTDEIIVENKVYETKKPLFDAFSDIAAKTSVVDTRKRSQENVFDAIEIFSEDADIFYKLLLSVDNGYEIASALADFEVRWMIGETHDDIAIVSIEGGNLVRYFCGFSDALTLTVSCIASLLMMMSASGETVMTSALNAGLKRYCLLEEFDPYTLGENDDFTLSDMDYEELEY